jgi:hypothetical protein
MKTSPVLSALSFPALLRFKNEAELSLGAFLGASDSTSGIEPAAIERELLTSLLLLLGNAKRRAARPERHVAPCNGRLRGDRAHSFELERPPSSENCGNVPVCLVFCFSVVQLLLRIGMRKQNHFELTAVVAAVGLMFGCRAGWESLPAPDMKGTNAMSAVSSFIATNGWQMHTGGLAFSYGKEQTTLLRGLPWRTLNTDAFPALTHNGILYVVLGGWHHDVHGVAYNPNTNRFPPAIAGFRPLGGHWYVWAQSEDPIELKQRYE